MEKYSQLLADYRVKVNKALSYLDYSYNKVQKLPKSVRELDQETLETWESFSVRFFRVADLFLGKYVRAFVLSQDPGFKGTMRDFVNQAEKLQLIDDARAWMEIRELRNITAHGYSDEDLEKFLLRLYEVAPTLLSISKVLSK